MRIGASPPESEDTTSTGVATSAAAGIATSFTGNRALGQGGGALLIQQMGLVIDGAVFVNNSARLVGGAVYVSGAAAVEVLQVRNQQGAWGLFG